MKPTNSDNLAMWNRVQKTDPTYTKKIEKKDKGGRVVHTTTAICAQYQIMNATQEWGSYGTTWGLKDSELDFDQVGLTGMVLYKVTFYYPGGEFVIRNAIMMLVGAKRYADKDFLKKLETDTTTKALSKLGFNADVFLGEFDDIEYVMQREAEVQMENAEGQEEYQKEQVKKIKADIAESLAQFKLFPEAVSLENFKNKILEKSRKQLQLIKVNPSKFDAQIEKAYETCRANLSK